MEGQSKHLLAIVDGLNGTIWEQFVPVQPGEEYNFSFDYYPDVSGGASPTLELWVANTPVLTGIVAPLGVWTSYCASWRYTGAVPFSAKIEIRQVQLAQNSDYGIDNVSFRKCESDLEVIALRDTTVCTWDPVQLDALVFGASGGYTCSWLPTPDLSDPNICDPVFTPSAPGTYVFTVTVTDAAGCSNSDDVTITVLPQPVLYVVSNSPVCEGNVLQMCDLAGQATSWQWTGPNSFTSTLPCPVISPADPNDSGIYTVIGTNADGCSDTVSIDVTVFPELTVTHPAGISVCEWTPVTLSPTISGGSGSYSCSWSPAGNLNSAASCTPIFTAPSTGVFIMTMTVTDNVTGCTESIQFDILSQNCCTPTATSCNACPYDCFTQGTDLVINGGFSGGYNNFGSDLDTACVCQAGTYCISDNARDKCTNGLWQPIYAPDCVGDYMIVDGANGNIWRQTIVPSPSVTYNFAFDFYPNISGSNSPVLELWVNGSVVKTAFTGPLNQWSRQCASWTAPPPPIPSMVIEIRQLANGTYGDYGIDNIEFTECLPPPMVTTISDTTICEDELINLNTIITGGVAPITCQWSPTGGIVTPTDCNPTFKKQQAGVYPLQVVVTDATGCTDTANVIITVERCCTPEPLTCNACTSCTSLGAELVTNGDFSQGNTGFTTGLNPIEQCICAGNSYCVADNARDKCTNGQWQFIQAPDCDSFMVVDADIGKIWEQTNILVNAGQIYNFSFALYPNISGNGSPELELQVDGTAISSGITGTAGAWNAHCATYTASTNATVTLTIQQTGNAGGNGDYGLDMISFRPCGSVPEITGLADTTICDLEDLQLNPIITGGSGSYSCSWSPINHLDDPLSCTPIFSTGTPGTYTLTVAVTDNVTDCTAEETIVITVEDCCVPVATNCNACTNACTGPGPELVFNGDFALGNVGFTSGLGNQDSCVCVADSYCIGDNARDKCTNGLWQPIKAPDCDSFMIVDGENGMIWQQPSIPVVAGETYNFSFALYPDISGNGGPVLELRVNNSSIMGGITGTAGAWTGQCAAFTATTTSFVTLSIHQTSGTGYNDYGLDRVSFRKCDSDPMVTISPIADFCESGSAVLNTIITGGTGTPTCQWSPATGLSSTTDCNPTVSGLSSGLHTYSVTVTDPSMCTATASVSFDVLRSPNVNGILFNQVCEGDDLNLGVSLSGTPVGYQWDGPNLFNSTASNPTIQNVTGNNAGLYSVTVTMSNGCTGTASQNIPVNWNNGIIFTSFNAPVCYLGTLNLMATGAPMASYSWTGPNSFVSNQQNPSIPNAQQAIHGGIYYLTVTDNNGCTRTWAQFVTIEPAPSILALSNTPVCVGQPLQVYEVGGDAVSWNWNGPGGFNGTSQIETRPNATLNMSGNYWVTITDGQGCTTQAVAMVSVLDGPTISNLPDTTLCEWDSYQFNPVITGGSSSYTCSYSPTPNLSNPGICNPVFQSPTAGTFTYTLTVTDNNTGCVSTHTFTITVTNCCMPIATNCNTCMTGCQGPDLVIAGDFNSLPGNANIGSALNAAQGCLGNTYWIGNNALAKCNTNALWNSVSAPDCGNFLIVDAEPGPPPFPPIFPPYPIWSQMVNVTAGSIYNFGFDFYPDLSSGTSPGLDMRINNGTVQANIMSPLGTWTGICQSWTATFTGQVLLEIRLANYGQYSDFGIDNVTFTECLRGPTVAIIPDTLICETDCLTLTTNITANGSHTCSWSPITGLNNPTLCLPTACGLPLGIHTYTVTVTDAAGCMGTNSVNITVKPQPTAIAVSNSPVCEGDDIQLNEIGGNSISWSWTGPSFNSILQNPVIPNATPLNSGTYTVITETIAGCKDTATVNVTVHPELAISGLTNMTVCEGDPVLLNPTISNGSNSYSCLWTPSLYLNNDLSCSPTFNATNAGVYTYTVTVTDNATGCTATSSVTMTAQICCTPTQTGCNACSSFCGSNELVINGGFEQGNVNFNSLLPYDCTCTPNSYCIDDNARDKCAHPLWKPIRSPDCVGNFMIVDGGHPRVWNQNVSVIAGNTYFFGFDFYPNLSDGASPALEMLINGAPLLSNITAPLDMWTSHCASWTAPNGGVVTLEIKQTFYAYRSDFGIDNISFRECYDLEMTADADTTICLDSTLVISATHKGGTPPVTCQWSPTPGLSNPNSCNPLFTPPGIGTYNFIVTGTDSTNCTDTDTIVVEVEDCCQIMVEALGDTTICSSSDTVYLDAIVTGENGPYNCFWSPIPGLSDPSICDPYVTGLPSGTHTYYVTVEDGTMCTATDSVKITVGNCCLVMNGPTIDPFNLNNSVSSQTLWGLDFWDMNADGIEDMVYTSSPNGPMNVYLNNGSVTTPTFSSTSTAVGINAFGAYNIDYNQDGFMDFFAWISDELHYFENTGTVSSGLYAYAPSVYTQVDMPPHTLNWFARPAIGDLNNDGMPDVAIALVSNVFGALPEVHYYENTAANINVPPTFAHIGNPLMAVNQGNGYSVPFPEIFDGDCDGDLDLFVGVATELQFYENGGTVTSLSNPDLNQTPVVNPFGVNGIAFDTEHAIPRFVEIDDDNNVELFIREDDFGTERMLFFENNCPCPSFLNQFRCVQSMLNLNGQPVIPGLYHAIEEVNSNGNIASGMTVDYRAGNGLTLDLGFNVELGGQFSAGIESCSTPFAPSQQAVFLQNTPHWQVSSSTESTLKLQVYLSVSAETEVQLFDIQGQTHPVQIKAIGTGLELEQSGLPTGLYFLLVKTEEGEWRERIVVQRE